jgi:hypothetical protein
MRTLFLACAIAAFALAGPLPKSIAAEAKPAASTTAKKKPLPFHGNVGQVDRTANSVKVGKRVFFVTPETKVMKNGKQASLADAVPGDEVGGAYRDVGGRLVLVTLRLGPKQ